LVKAVNPTAGWIRRHKILLLVVLSILLSAFLRLPYFQYDFIFVDEACWANGANVLTRGGQLYLDIALDKNPPIFWVCALLFKVLGLSMTAIHIGALLLVCSTSVLLYLLGSRFFSKEAGAAASLTHAAASATYYIPRIIGMNSETLMVFFSALAAFFYLQALIRNRRYGFFVSGLFASFALLTKPVYGPEFAMLFLFLFLQRDQGFTARLRSGLEILSGFILGMALVTGYMYRTGILFAWWDQAIVYAFRYVGRISTHAFLFKSFRIAVAFGLIFAWLFILIGLSRRTKTENPRAYAFLICWLAAAFAGVIVGRRYYANYFIQAMPPLSLLGGLGLMYLWNNRAQKNLRIAARFCCAAFLVSFVWFHSRTLVNWCSFAFPQLRDVKYWEMGQEEKLNREVAAHIRDKSSPGDTLFIWGSKPQLFFLSQRQTATGWMDYDVADDYPPRAGEMESQHRMAEYLRKTKPRFIADVQKVAKIEKHPIFHQVVKDFYYLEAEISGIRLFRLRED
jgi:4-amino-4-deoxy-L-arabinose transferase-like glycosyltransferase